jgi:DNA-binding PadR family transcriptional regulator
MGNSRSVSGLAALALLAVVVAAPGAAVRAQSSPASRADENATILRPLTEIGRVRARTPFCAALANARTGIDAAVAYEYAVPIVADELRKFRFDTYLTNYQSKERTEADLRALYNIARAGREQIQALRDAANAPGVEPEQRKQMIAFADALDGAKARQLWLAKQMARTLAVTEELPVRNMMDRAADDHGSSGLETKLRQAPITFGPTPPPAATDTTSDAIANTQQQQRVFNTFGDEEPIRQDLKVASEHGTSAMQLGNCNGP